MSDFNFPAPYNNRISFGDISFSMLLIFVLIVISTGLCFFVGIVVGVHHLIIATVFAWVIFYYFNGKDIKKTNCAILSAIVLIFLFCVISSCVYDATWDGAAYHKQAVGLLYEGWNPIYQSAAYYEQLAHTTPYLAANPLLWAETYPKATWYFASNIYKLFNNIEAGKSYTLIFSCITAGFFYDYCREKKLKVYLAVIVALIAALNPIALAQMQSYYLDGLVCSLVMSLLLMMLRSFDKSLTTHYRRDTIITIPALLVIGCNLKFSILLLCVIYCGVYTVMIWGYNRKSFKIEKKTLSYTALLAGTGVLSTFVVGASPYITNIIRYKSMFGSFMNLLSNAEATDNSGLSGLSNIQLLLSSIFGKMSHGEYTTLSELLKMPFTINKSELLYYTFVDTRMSGMGVLYSGILILTIILMSITIAICIKNRVKISSQGKLYIGLCIATICYVTILPLTFQLRYIGFVYFFTVFSIITILMYLQEKKRNWLYLAAKIVCGLLGITIACNGAPWFIVFAERINQGADTTATLQMLSNMQLTENQLQIALYSKDFSGIHYNLQNDYNLEYTYVNYEDISEMSGFSSTYNNWVYYRIIDSQDG